MTEKGFSELNLEELKVLASNWAQEHDAIEKITLYRGSSVSGARYVFVATAAPFPDEEARKKLQSDTHIPVQGENILVAETIDYYNWAAADCLQIEDDLKSAYKDLEHAPEFIRDEWMWFPIEPGEETPHVLVNDNFLVTLYEKFKQKRNLTPNQEDKKACQEIAKKRWDEYYQQLNLTELKVMAQAWANRFSVIKQITLYRADRDGKYVLDVRIDDSDKIEYRDFEEYWIDKACYLDRLNDVYKTPDTDYYREWLFHLPEVGGEPLSKDDQVLTDSRLILFPRDDERLIEKPSQISNDKERKETLINQLSEQDLDVFIRKLTVIPESNYEIKIKEPGKKPETYNHERLGFKDNIAKEWGTFLDILNNSGSYSIGQADMPGTAIRKGYNRKLSYLRAIDKKLKDAFHKGFSLQFPEGYRLYERFKTEGWGVYKFKFQVKFSLKTADRSLKAKYEKYPKDKLLEYLKNINDTYAKTFQERLKLQIDTAKEVLLEKHKMNNDDINDYIDPRSDHEEINNMFSTFEKSEKE